MTLTLTSFETRVRAILLDNDRLTWDTETLDESIRLALGEYGLAAGAAVSLQGLDGAAATTLAPLHDSLVVWGAAGYAALAQSAGRAETAQLGSDPDALRAWGDQRLAEFRAMLAVIYPCSAAQEAARLAALRTSTDANWGTWEGIRI